MQACKDFGFFYVENHGVSEEVMAEVFRQSRAFFSLGISDKLAVKADKNNRGFTPMHEEILDPAKQAKGDTKVLLRALQGYSRATVGCREQRGDGGSGAVALGLFTTSSRCGGMNVMFSEGLLARWLRQSFLSVL